jgi:phage shock protein C
MSMSTHLYRSRDDRMLAGVAGGLADLWDADPSLVRIIWALLVVFTGGIALVVYIVMAIVVPEESDDVSWAGQQSPPAGAPPDIADTPASGSTSPVSGSTSPADTSPSAAGAAPGPSTADWRTSRFEAREQRRSARREARADRHARRSDSRSGPIVVGIVLVLVGVFALVREYLPEIDWDWFWPVALIAVGVAVLALAVRPRPDDGGPGGIDRGAGG